MGRRLAAEHCRLVWMHQERHINKIISAGSMALILYLTVGSRPNGLELAQEKIILAISTFPAQQDLDAAYLPASCIHVLQSLRSMSPLSLISQVFSDSLPRHSQPCAYPA